MIPTGVELFASDAAFFGLVLFKQVQGKAAESGQVFGRVTSARPALVLSETNVHHPMDFVFHTPMAANCPREGLNPQR